MVSPEPAKRITLGRIEAEETDRANPRRQRHLMEPGLQLAVHDQQPLGPDIDGEPDGIAVEEDIAKLTGEAVEPGRQPASSAEHHLLRPDRERDPGTHRRRGALQRDADVGCAATHLRGAVRRHGHGAGDHVGGAEKVRDVGCLGPVVEVGRRARLHDAAGVHHHDPVGHHQRLGLIVGDHHEGEADLVVQALELHLHRLAELGVERRHRLVQ